MTRRSRILLGMALALVTLGVGGFLAKAQITAIMTKSPTRDRPMHRAQLEVIAAFSQIEKAIQSGDGALFLRLMSRKVVAAQADVIKVTYLAGLPPRPDAHLEPIAVCVRGDNAFVIGKFEERGATEPKTYLVRYVREEQAWKIAALRTTSAPPYQPAIYAYLPPDGGAFTLAGSPWRTIGYAGLASESFWKLQTTRDEAFLHIRFEASAALPPHGSEASVDDGKLMKGGVPSDPPVMTVSVTRPDDNQTLVKSSFELQIGRAAAAVPRASADATGAEQARSVVNYSMVVRGDNGDVLFDSAPGAFNRLIEVRDRYVDVRLPLKSLGLHGRTTPDVELRETKAAQAKPYQVARFSP
jgi:hypothetical protein